MEITHLEIQNGYLFVAGIGEFDYRLAMEQFARVVAQAKTHACTRVLVDFTKIEGDISILTLYQVASQISNAAAEITALALIDRPERILPDRFWEKTAQNRGFNARVFGSMDEGRRWITAVHANSDQAPSY